MAKIESSKTPSKPMANKAPAAAAKPVATATASKGAPVKGGKPQGNTKKPG